MARNKPKIAVVLLNLGGPDSPEAIRPFLFNLFYDPAIMSLPNPLRFLLAKLISARREATTKRIYDQLGGSSPLLANTNKQALALKSALKKEWDVEVFPCMRYWHPLTEEVVEKVKEYAPEQVILLPLYPQFSTTTTASSVKRWQMEAKRQDLQVPATAAACCYPTGAGFIKAYAGLVKTHYEAALEHGTPRILFSAHGLPEKLIRKGDPYQWQVEQTTIAIVEKLGIPFVDFKNCYQSRVGPLKWIGPSTKEEIARAGKDGVPLVVVPVSFTSEHSETLVELDRDYAELAKQSGVPYYARVPAVGDQPDFINGLARICKSLHGHHGTRPGEQPERICPNNWSQCPCKPS